MPFFEDFYPFIKENFYKNYDQFLKIAEQKNEEFYKEVRSFKTVFYGMDIQIDYNKVIKKLKETKNNT